MRNLVEKIHSKYSRKYHRSMVCFIVLNIVSFMVASILIFLNAYAIKKNNNEYLKVIFVVIAILGAIGAFITTVTSFFTIRKQASKSKGKINEIKDHFKRYKNKEGEYKKQLGREKLFIENVLEISGE